MLLGYKSLSPLHSRSHTTPHHPSIEEESPVEGLGGPLSSAPTTTSIAQFYHRVPLPVEPQLNSLHP